jgi:hypothetical protein
MQAGQLAAVRLPYPLPVLIAIQVLQNVVLFAIAIGLGMLAANRIGLGLPILEANLAGEKVGVKIKAILPISIIIGVVGSLIIIALDKWVFNPGIMTQLGEQAKALNLQSGQPAAWKGLLASFCDDLCREKATASQAPHDPTVYVSA